MEQLLMRLRVALAGENGELATALSGVVDALEAGDATLRNQLTDMLFTIVAGSTDSSDQPSVHVIDLFDDDDLGDSAVIDGDDLTDDGDDANDIENDDDDSADGNGLEDTDADIIVGADLFGLGDDDGGDFVFDDGPAGVDLEVRVDAGASTRELGALLAVVIEQLGLIGSYEELSRTTIGEKHVIVLTALDGAGAGLIDLPPGTCVFANPVDALGAPYQVDVVVAGPIDPDRPPLVIEDAIEEQLCAVGEDLGIDPATLRIGRIFAAFESCDNPTLATADLDGPRGPMEMFKQNLEARIGPIFELSRQVNEEDPARVDVIFEPVDNGNVMLLGMAVSLVGYKGTLPFGKLGKITAGIVEVLPENVAQLG